MDRKEIKQLIKTEIVPYLIGIRNEIEEVVKDPFGQSKNADSPFKGMMVFKGDPGDDGHTPEEGKDFHGKETQEKIITELVIKSLPKKGKEYFTAKDIKEMVRAVFELMPSKEELKGKDATVDYSKVKEYAKPLIDERYAELKKEIGIVTKELVDYVDAVDAKKKKPLTETQIKRLLKRMIEEEIRKNPQTFIIGGGGATGGGVSTFLGLTDAPDSYASQAGKGVRVSADETALEFYTIAGDTDEKVALFAGDTAGYLNDKIVEGGYAVSIFSNDAGYLAPGANISNFTNDSGYITSSALSSYVPTSRTITIAGTTNQVVSSAGAQDMSENRTWTLSLPQNIHTSATPQFQRIGIGAAASATISNLTVVGTSTHIAQVVRGASSQSGDLSEWQNSSSQILSYVDKTGYFKINNLQSTTTPTSGTSVVDITSYSNNTIGALGLRVYALNRTQYIGIDWNAITATNALNFHVGGGSGNIYMLSDGTTAGTGGVCIGQNLGTANGRLVVFGRAGTSGPGTVATTTGSNIVTGTSTTFTINIDNGYTITIGGNVYAIASVDSATQLTLYTAAVATVSGSAYTYTTPTAMFKNNGQTAFYAVNSLGQVETKETVSPQTLYNRIGSKTWSVGIDSSNNNRFFFKNVSNSTVPFYIDGSAGADSLYLDSANRASLIAGAAVSKRARAGGKIKEFFTSVGNVGTGEDDLYSYTTEASILGTNGEEIDGSFGGTFVSSATATRQLKLWFGGTAIFDTGALSLSTSSSWVLSYSIIRVSASVVRYRINLSTQGAALSAYTSAGELTGLTLSNTNILKLTGESAGVGAATDDIVATSGDAFWWPVSV